MSELFETLMLVCFGISWPISLYKAYKSRTAKSTSAFFIMFIMLGYIAGICAKLVVHNYSYVLYVYFFNLVMVGLNLVVYFINSSRDKRKSQA